MSLLFNGIENLRRVFPIILIIAFVMLVYINFYLVPYIEGQKEYKRITSHIQVIENKLNFKLATRYASVLTIAKNFPSPSNYDNWVLTEDVKLNDAKLLNLIISGPMNKRVKISLGDNNYVYNVIFINIDVEIAGSSNILYKVKIDGNNSSPYGLRILGNNNIIYEIDIQNVGIGVEIYSSNNTLMKFNITNVGRGPVKESPKLISIKNGNDNIVSLGYGKAPYSNWGIYVEGGAENIIHNVTITSAHNYFKFGDVKTLYLIMPKAIREEGMYGDDYFEGNAIEGGEIYVFEPTATSSGTEAFILGGGNFTFYIVKPKFYKNQGLFSFTNPNNLTLIIVNGSLSLIETSTWYRSIITHGVRMILICSRVTLLDFYTQGGIIESLPEPLWLVIVVSSMQDYGALLFLTIIIFVVPTSIMKYIIRRQRKSKNEGNERI